MDEPRREILEGVASLDESACAALIRLVEPLIRAALTGWRFESEDDREDVFQEIRCAVIDGVRRYDPRRGRFSSWVYGVTRNVCNSYVREGTRRPEIAFSRLAEDFEPSGAGTEDVQEPDPSTLLQAFRAVYNELAPDDRIVVDHMLRHVSGIATHRDLAVAKGISEAAAKQEVYRKKAWLKRAIEERLGRLRYPVTKTGGSP